MSASGQCAACGVNLLEDSAFCHGCGKPVGAGAGEHKPISVLFIDAFGSIGLDDRLDAEKWHEVMESFFAAVSTTVQHYGGTIDRLTGEGIKVLFGAPVALESHATQACHAALRLRERLDGFARSFRAQAGVEFAARMGISSGDAVFGPVGPNGGGAFTSQGHVAALAARMQQLAEPGGIYLTEDTAALVADYFELHELGELAVRNANRRVRTFELVAARADRTRLDAARERGLSPLLGREVELAELDASLRAASRHGMRIVGVVGEPGIGKSRLVEDFAEAQRARGVPVHVTHCAEHARWIPFHTTVPFLRAAFGVRATDEPARVRQRITEMLRELDPALLDTLPVLLTAFGIADADEAARATAGSTPTRAFARILRALLDRREPVAPAIFVVDDQQWMDPGADALFGEMVRNPPSTPVLILVTYRRGHERRWMHDDHFRELSLRPLDDATTLRLVRTVMGDDRSLRTLQARIVERAAGNPLFVEETILSLAAAGAIEGPPGAYRLGNPDAEVVVPGSLYAILASRIDRLGEREKAVLQAASVIGRDFPVALLAQITGLDAHELASVLRTLETGDFVSAVGWGEEAHYHFRHPLLQQTAYRSLLKDRRAVVHRTVADALAKPWGTRNNPQAGRIALHAEAAGDDLEAARWHRRAAWQTLGWDPGQSYVHWRHVLSCTGRIAGEDAARLRVLACEAVVRLGFHQGLSADEAEALVREGSQIARRFGDVRMQALLSSAIGSLRGCTGDVDAGIAHQRDALRHAEQVREPGLALLTAAQLLLSNRVAGRIDDGLRLADAMLAAYRPENVAALGPDLVALRQLELGRAMLLLDRGRLDDGARELTRIITAMRDEGSPVAYAWALSLTATVVRHVGDPAPVLAARIEEAHERAVRTAVPSVVGRTLCSLAALRLSQNRWDEARVLAEEACEVMRGLGHTFYVDFDPRLALSYARFGIGDIPGARAAATEAMEHAFTSGARLGQIDTLGALGRLLIRYGSLAEIGRGRTMLRHGLALVRRCRARSREPYFWLELAGLDRRGGNERRAIARTRRGVRQLVAMNAYGHVPRMPGLLNPPTERAHLRDEIP
jgi:adenylate cyclase